MRPGLRFFSWSRDSRDPLKNVNKNTTGGQEISRQQASAAESRLWFDGFIIMADEILLKLFPELPGYEMECSKCNRIFLNLESFVEHFANLGGQTEVEINDVRMKCNHGYFGPCPRSKRREVILRHLLQEDLTLAEAVKEKVPTLFPVLRHLKKNRLEAAAAAAAAATDEVKSRSNEDKVKMIEEKGRIADEVETRSNEVSLTQDGNKAIPDRKDRKKMSNVNAARRYRDKKRSETLELEAEEQALLAKNAELKVELTDIETELKITRKLLLQAAAAAKPMHFNYHNFSFMNK